MSAGGYRPPARLAWPDGLDEAGFLTRCWQRAPLLLRQALPGFETPLPPDELAGLATEPDTTPRLVRRDAEDRYTLEHGPFDETAFAALGETGWSLLVTDVEKHLPELRDWLRPFDFLPSWRRDDLMVSHAPDGASVGAHVDEYDVFLLQASGSRRWSIDTRADVARESRAGGALRLLADFAPTETHTLFPGDILYLPPGVPHHGVAVGEDCTTWSIGFRAPSRSELLLGIAELLAERLEATGADTRFRDGPLAPAVAGEIAADALARLDALWEEATRPDAAMFAELVGRFLTRDGDAAADGALDAGANDDAGAEGACTDGGSDRAETRVSSSTARLRSAPFSRLAWHGDGARVALFVDGEAYRCSHALAIALCRVEGIGADEIASLDEAGRALVATLRERGALVAV